LFGLELEVRGNEEKRDVKRGKAVASFKGELG